MTQKRIEDRLTAAEAKVGERRKELQRLLVLEKGVEAITTEMEEVQKTLKLLVEELLGEPKKGKETTSIEIGRRKKEKSGWRNGKFSEG